MTQTTQHQDRGLALIDIHPVPVESSLTFGARLKAHGYLIAESKKLINRLPDFYGNRQADQPTRWNAQLKLRARRTTDEGPGTGPVGTLTDK